MSTKLVRFLIFTLLVVNSTAGQQGKGKSQPPQAPKATSSATNSKLWYVFNAPDKDFVIEFPTRPKREADTEAPSGTMHNYVLNTDSISYSFSYVDTGLEPTSREGNQLPQMFRKSMLENAAEQGWVVLRSELLRKNVYEQETWSPIKRKPDQRLHYIERNIVRYGRQYILTCASLIPEQKVNSELCRRFFNSFQVIGEPQPQ